MNHKRILEKAIQLQDAGRHDEALHVFNAVLGKTIDDPYTLYCTGTAFLVKGMFGVAMTLISQSLQTEKQSAEREQRGVGIWYPAAWNNLAACLKHEKHRDLAIKAFNEALAIKTDASTLGNLSGMYVNWGEPEKAIEIAQKALALDPYQPQAGQHYAFGHLELGNYEEGFRWYNSRLRLPEFDHRHYPGQMWDGEHVETLVIHGEQGVGDEIMFASQIRKAQERVGRVVIECVGKLIPVFERTFGVPCYENKEALLAKEKPDAWIPMGSLPNLFQVYKPLQHKGYLQPDAERVAYWKAKYPGPRIGISWRGGTKFTHWELRNFAIEEWLPLTRSGQLISLQYGDWPHEIAEMGISDAKPVDFDDHMALVAACDLVISVCNTTVHMAGSMNIPCWTLVPDKPAWRYSMRGERMFWYPSAKFYRQTGEWSEVIERIRSDLHAYQQRLSAPESGDAPNQTRVWDYGRGLRLASGAVG